MFAHLILSGLIDPYKKVDYIQYDSTCISMRWRVKIGHQILNIVLQKLMGRIIRSGRES